MKVLRVTGAEEWAGLVERVKWEEIKLVFWTDPRSSLETARAMARDLDVSVALVVPRFGNGTKLAAFLRDAAIRDEAELVPVFEALADVRRAIYWLHPDRMYGRLFGEDVPGAPGTWVDLREGRAPPA